MLENYSHEDAPHYPRSSAAIRFARVVSPASARTVQRSRVRFVDATCDRTRCASLAAAVLAPDRAPQATEVVAAAQPSTTDVSTTERASAPGTASAEGTKRPAPRSAPKPKTVLTPAEENADEPDTHAAQAQDAQAQRGQDDQLDRSRRRSQDRQGHQRTRARSASNHGNRWSSPEPRGINRLSSSGHRRSRSRSRDRSSSPAARKRRGDVLLALSDLQDVNFDVLARIADSNPEVHQVLSNVMVTVAVARRAPAGPIRRRRSRSRSRDRSDSPSHKRRGDVLLALADLHDANRDELAKIADSNPDVHQALSNIMSLSVGCAAPAGPKRSPFHLAMLQVIRKSMAETIQGALQTARRFTAAAAQHRGRVNASFERAKTDVTDAAALYGAQCLSAMTLQKTLERAVVWRECRLETQASDLMFNILGKSAADRAALTVREFEKICDRIKNKPRDALTGTAAEEKDKPSTNQRSTGPSRWSRR